MRNAPELIRYVATRSWIAVGSSALLFATEENELIRVELDKETVTLLREKIPAGIWPEVA